MPIPNQHVDITKLQPDEQHHWEDCTLKGCGICQELAQLEKDIDTAQEIVRNLTQRRFTLKSSRNAIHDRLTSRLPIEIISEIFICHENFNNPEYNSNSSNRLVYGPTVLSSVCRRWREICLSLPNLWTNVYINLWREPVQIADEWLNRSAALPLCLTLYTHTGSRTLAWNLTSESVCKVLLSHSARWQYLNIEHASPNSLYRLFKSLEIMPESTSFHLRVGSYMHVHESSVISPKTALRPGRVLIDNANIYTVLPLEWSNLTHIELSYYPLFGVLDIIRAAPRLKRCDSQFMDCLSGTPASPVKHLALEELDVSFRASSTDPFQHLTFPSLRHLKYNTGSDLPSQWNGFHDLKNFLVRSELYDSPRLQTFTLRCWSSAFPDGDLSKIFDLTTVTHLTVSPGVVELLFLKMSQDGSIFPYLQELKFELILKFTPRGEVLSMGPAPFTALGKFVTQHNLNALSAAAAALDGESFVSDQLIVYLRDSPTANLTSVDAKPHLYRRSFKTISIQLMRSPRGSTLKRLVNRIKMTKDTYLRLQEAQKSGPLKVNIVDFLEGSGEVDVLHDARCLKDDGRIDGFVVLQSAAISSQSTY